ncbi:MAG TPA: 30S ribosomal protein S20 [Candidatus Saccharimonadales bacterium]|nr:30S ribosomal protein S20 [Candidatus Saccharimonadales bacterium]
MPIIKSARKRVKVAAKARSRNLHTKRQVRESLKAFAAALQSGKPAEVAKAQAAAVSALDVAVKKDITHKNKAARFKSRMAKQAKAAGMKPSATKAVKPKAAAKKPKASAKTAAKKPVRQAQGKTAAKKTASKK